MFGKQYLPAMANYTIDRLRNENQEEWASLRRAYEDPIVMNALLTIQRIIGETTSLSPSLEQLRLFLHNFPALYMSGDLIAEMNKRVIEQMANSNNEDKYAELARSAQAIAEILSDEFGLNGVPHADQYKTFAISLSGSLSGGHEWKHKKYTVPEVTNFHYFLQQALLHESLDNSFLTTAAQELSISAICSYLFQFIHDWALGVLGVDLHQSRRALAFVAVHACDRETAHFLYALRAWRAFHKANRCMPEPRNARSFFIHYFEEIQPALTAFERALHEV